MSAYLYLPRATGGTDKLRAACKGQKRPRLGLERKKRHRRPRPGRRNRIQSFPAWRPWPSWNSGTGSGLGWKIAHRVGSRQRNNGQSGDSCGGGRMRRIRILIADDYGIGPKGLRLQLAQNEAFGIVGEGAGRREDVRLSEELCAHGVNME